MLHHDGFVGHGHVHAAHTQCADGRDARHRVLDAEADEGVVQAQGRVGRIVDFRRERKGRAHDRTAQGWQGVGHACLLVLDL